MIEIWKDIYGYENVYQISNLGNIKSLERIIYDKNNKISGRLKERILKPNKVFGGYLQIALYKNNKRSIKKVHRLVAEHFLNNKENKREVNHKDRNVQNNIYTNLEWVTPKENMKHLEDNYKFTFGRKKVAMYDINGILIKTFKSIKEASRYCGVKPFKNGKYSTTNISRAIKTNGTAYFYKWKYIE